MHTLHWDQPATLIDLDGKTPLFATLRECVVHYTLSTPHARQQARILLAGPVLRTDRKSRTWLLDPREIELLAERLNDERPAGE